MNKTIPNKEHTLTFPHESLLIWAKEKPNDIFLRQIINRKFVDYTFFDTVDRALKLVSALQSLGLKPKDRIALISKNCAEWFITDLALMLGGFVSVPIFPTSDSSTISHCLSHSESKAIFIGKLDSKENIEQLMTELPELISISFNYDSAPQCKYQFEALIEQYKATDQIQQPFDDDLMSIVYTSGTSGLPKGAMLTYGGFKQVTHLLNQHIGINENDRLFSYLPLAHITERVYILGSAFLGGIQTAFPESLDTFIDDVKMQRPTLFISVPRLWTLFQQRILNQLPQKKLHILLQIPLINRIIKHKLASALGLNKARVLGCGSAPVSPALLKWYYDIGLKITEAWGMTETFAYSTLNYPFRLDKIGSVGSIAPGVEVHIASDQEILIKGQGLFSGYYKNEQATKETFDENGWLCTGDLGSLDKEGFLTIHGRKKDTFKTAKGKFVAPVPIEKKIFDLTKLEMMCLIGSGISAPILLIVPPSLPKFNKERYEKTVIKNLTIINDTLESHAKLKGVFIIKEPWSVENGILTPTLKIKRHILEKKYHDIADNWPIDKKVIWE